MLSPLRFSDGKQVVIPTIVHFISSCVTGNWKGNMFLFKEVFGNEETEHDTLFVISGELSCDNSLSGSTFITFVPSNRVPFLGMIFVLALFLGKVRVFDIVFLA